MNWRHQALCRDTDPELFFGPNDSTGTDITHNWEHTAITVCNRCPVRRDCLNDALRSSHSYGVAGGRTAGQRKALLTDRRTAPAGTR